jgi:RNA polymerase sigma-70 factor (ECF subfamily)
MGAAICFLTIRRIDPHFPSPGRRQMTENPIPDPLQDEAAEAVSRSLREHYGRLRHYVDVHLPADLREWLDPQDVVQDVFLDAFRRRQDFPRHNAEEGMRWLLTVARHLLIDLVRQHRALKRPGSAGRVRVGIDESLTVMLEQLGLYLRTPSRSAAEREFFSAFDHALNRLPPDYAQVIRLRHVEGLSQRDAAHRMGRTEKAVESLCARGLAALRVEMRSASLFV